MSRGVADRLWAAEDNQRLRVCPRRDWLAGVHVHPPNGQSPLGQDGRERALVLERRVLEHEDPRGTLVAFVSDEQADAMFELSEQDRRAAILTGIADFLGPQALDPVVYYESDWASEEWTRGAYAASFDLGGLSRYGRDQATPVGRVHWAGSDIATAGYQHVDGALRSGRAAAEAIMATELVPTA